MRVYLAGPYQWKERLGIYRSALLQAGLECTSTWLDEAEKPDTQLHEVYEQTLEKYAECDLEDVERADALVLFAVPPTDAPIPRAGRHVEFGYALALQIPIIVVGCKENIFHYLKRRVQHAETWDAALATLINRSVLVTGR